MSCWPPAWFVPFWSYTAAVRSLPSSPGRSSSYGWEKCAPPSTPHSRVASSFSSNAAVWNKAIAQRAPRLPTFPAALPSAGPRIPRARRSLITSFIWAAASKSHLSSFVGTPSYSLVPPSPASWPSSPCSSPVLSRSNGISSNPVPCHQMSATNCHYKYWAFLTRRECTLMLATSSSYQMFFYYSRLLCVFTITVAHRDHP